MRVSLCIIIPACAVEDMYLIDNITTDLIMLLC